MIKFPRQDHWSNALCHLVIIYVNHLFSVRVCFVHAVIAIDAFFKGKVCLTARTESWLI